MGDKRSGRRKENVSKNVDGDIFIEDSSTLKNGFNLKGLLLTVCVCLFHLSETSVRSDRGSCYFRWAPTQGGQGWVGGDLTRAKHKTCIPSQDLV